MNVDFNSGENLCAVDDSMNVDFNSGENATDFTILVGLSSGENAADFIMALTSSVAADATPTTATINARIIPAPITILIRFMSEFLRLNWWRRYLILRLYLIQKNTRINHGILNQMKNAGQY
jgi:hypothetical protein